MTVRDLMKYLLECDMDSVISFVAVDGEGQSVVVDSFNVEEVEERQVHLIGNVFPISLELREV